MIFLFQHSDHAGSKYLEIWSAPDISSTKTQKTRQAKELNDKVNENIREKQAHLRDKPTGIVLLILENIKVHFLKNVSKIGYSESSLSCYNFSNATVLI